MTDHEKSLEKLIGEIMDKDISQDKKIVEQAIKNVNDGSFQIPKQDIVDDDFFKDLYKRVNEEK